ncbi:hypothetical protein L484_003501 [Morus notabilis]|uniref:Uncharacterized protein n=1 Tax=Morus notabilis TaxID=981085 RepID=W9SE73_9ROSA|nr:hypothetical protein L484_003501 [Morus notabilis]
MRFKNKWGLLVCVAGWALCPSNQAVKPQAPPTGKVQLAAEDMPDYLHLKE